jgi:hypothetical protein
MARVSADQVVFDTYNRYSGRSLYNWALPMGSRLYSRGEVHSLLDAADLELTGQYHDFIVPFGLYRKLPGGAARALRRGEAAVTGTAVGERLASISYWSGTVDD